MIDKAHGFIFFVDTNHMPVQRSDGKLETYISSDVYARARQENSRHTHKTAVPILCFSHVDARRRVSQMNNPYRHRAHA